jgi:HlyD family type I secretion membrane fusion protein
MTDTNQDNLLMQLGKVASHKSESIAAKNIVIGMIVMAVFFGAFVTWGVLAPIDSASIASGKVVLDFNKKTIQHLEGGIVEKILVQEGQSVITDQPLISLRDIQSRAQNKMLRSQLITIKAMEIRLSSQRDEVKPDFSDISSEYKTKIDDDANDDNDDNILNIEVDKIIKTQTRLYEIRRDTHQSKVDILGKRVNQLKDQIKGIRSQKNATSREIRVLEQQKYMMQKLVNNNNSPLTNLLEIQKQIAVAEGRSGELKANIAKAKQSVSEAELEIVDLKNEYLNKVLNELQETETKISDLTEQLTSVKDVLKRTIIKSPASGIVSDLQYHTVGAVIAPGAEIMYIIPQDDELIIEARVNPIDIDTVKAGLDAKVQLTAFKAKKVPKLLGKVLSVSADILVDEATGEQYFLARIRINEGEISKLKESITLYPGMPAQAFIITGSRSLFDYLFDPITSAAYKAFREE